MNTGHKGLKVGDLVSVEKFDRSLSEANRIGTPAKVTMIKQERNCESGYMVSVLGTSGRSVRLDSNWLRPYPVKEDQL